ncbi:hypothetical protein HMPREF0201_00491 [Cedecea davisae DSM 4568]|uniref:Uncharacterized protein n=1 Tax=Cedecea davisae DSM 4568 TaxID=566551 RepID=S3J7X3_9ENTR|nr:hypothetical protein HMPREF0201_00491 [Cedecea davisae DSM 4568]
MSGQYVIALFYCLDLMGLILIFTLEPYKNNLSFIFVLWCC